MGILGRHRHRCGANTRRTSRPRKAGNAHKITPRPPQPRSAIFRRGLDVSKAVVRPTTSRARLPRSPGHPTGSTCTLGSRGSLEMTPSGSGGQALSRWRRSRTLVQSIRGRGRRWTGRFHERPRAHVAPGGGCEVVRSMCRWRGDRWWVWVGW